MKKNKLTLTLPLAITFMLMVLMVFYTSTLFYRVAVTNIYEVGEDKLSGISATIDNYLGTTKSVLWVTADSVDFMVKSGIPNDEILEYLMVETVNHKSQFDENYTGLYGYISGEYLDGLGWEPPEDYDPTQRDWYQIAVNSDKGIVIVPPYVDAQTGSMVISVCKKLSDSQNVVAIDIITTRVQEIISETSIKGKGYGFILDQDGTVIAHPDISLNGTNIRDTDGGSELMDRLGAQNGKRFESTLNGEKSTIFTDTLMDQWYLVIAVGNDELFKDVYVQLAVNIAANTIVFLLLALFYAYAYRKEQKSRSVAEALRTSERQKEYEAEILKLEKSTADASNKAKGEFLAQMSHEIRTPINAVLGMNEMILRESRDDRILEYSRNIRTAGKTLLSLINSILDFSKIEDGKMEIIPAKYDTVSMINSLINSVSERARTKGLTFTVNADPELPCMLIGDDVRLAQVIVNLLTNAVKYTDQGTVTLDIGCRERTENDLLLTVCVKDTGIGIREEDMDKLFMSFSRLDELRNRHIEGTGLGMAIVTRLLELMDSELHVESVYGEGSAFSFSVRQQIADPAPIGTALERREAPNERSEKIYPRFPSAKILVTDDNEMNLKVAKNLLKLFGIKPDLAASGAEAIEMMRSKRYSIVFLDHMMPKMDGIETFRKLKEEHLIPADTAVIALTANAVIGAREKYLAAGFTDYLSKPISLEELEEKLSEHLPAEAAEPEPSPVDEEIMEFYPDEEVMEFAPEKPSDDEPEDTTEALDALREAGFSVDAGLMYCAGDPGFYIEMLTDYAVCAPKRLQELEAALEASDWKQYQTLVHALKSISKTVGADNVFALARSMEEAAKNCDAAVIHEKHGELVTCYTDRINEIKEILHLSIS
ncbi:MAG: response regulator [Oscillospiraceae bacterium]|nr:response regulator [Oscillospiraceae bacterium]